jgi:hypothetical protein
MELAKSDLDCVRSLDSSATKARLKNVATSHSETLQWLFDTNVVDFSSWLQDPDSSSSPIYWIQGKPGSGKSTLMKFAMMDPRLSDLLQTSEHLPYVISGFFFHDRGTMVQKSMTGMLQELLYSVLVKNPALRQFVNPIYLALVDTQKTKLPTWNVESLQEGFETIIRQRQFKTRLCLFLDALDEHHGDNDHLVSLVKKLVTLADGEVVKIKLCLASRPWDTFVMNFSQCPGFKIQDHTYHDIRAYTLSEFQHSLPACIKDSSAENARSAKLEALALQVTEKAHGVFIWVRIVVEEITKGLKARTPLFVLEEMLAKMPEELKDLYEHTLERIEPGHAEEAFVMLQIALCALSPLLIKTFVNTTSWALWKRFAMAGEEPIEDMMQRVVSRSGGLLEVVYSTHTNLDISLPFGCRDTIEPFEETEFMSRDLSLPRVQFIHQTVKEYVQSREDNLGLKRTKSGGSGFQYILDAAVCCTNAWANEIGLDLFEYARLEYARLAGSDKNVKAQRELWDILDRIDYWISTSRLDWWIAQKNMDFYMLCFHLAKNRLKVIGLALAAGLLDFVHSRLGAKDFEPEWDRLLYVAAIGPPITSVQTPRRDMLNILFQYKNLTEYSMIGGGPFIFGRASPSPLAMIIDAKDVFDQDETERVSAIAFLLDHGGNPNQALPKSDYPEDTVFLKCIRQENAEVVRLFGQYGATLPREMILPLLSLWKMVSKPSLVLEEAIQIMRRDYPDIDEKWPINPHATIVYWDFPPVGIYFCDYESCAAAPIMAAIAAMGVSISQVFRSANDITLFPFGRNLE